jgi:hypothetical protein
VNLERALVQIDDAEPTRGDALVLQGQIAISQGELDLAYEKFHLVVRDFVATRSYLPGILGRAEVEGMLGDHQASQADYQLLKDLLPKGGPRRDIDAARIGQSLCDRHDAALALGKLDRALNYITIAEEFFGPDQVPPKCFFDWPQPIDRWAMMCWPRSGRNRMTSLALCRPKLIRPCACRPTSTTSKPGVLRSTRGGPDHDPPRRVRLDDVAVAVSRQLRPRWAAGPRNRAVSQVPGQSRCGRPQAPRNPLSNCALILRPAQV